MVKPAALVMVGLVALSLAVEARRGQQSAPPGPPASCDVAADDQYGYTPAQAIQVGGSPMYGAARQRQYLDSLRGPGGEAIQYKRIGQARAPDGTILDRYEILYAGLAMPIALFLDWYHYNPLKAPKGLTCATPINLGFPPVDPFREADDINTIAVSQGADRTFLPIPFGPDGDATHGVLYDRFRVLALASAAAAAKGEKLDPAQLPLALSRQGAILIAYPVTCGERTTRPTALDVIAPNGDPMPKEGRELTAGSASNLLYGARVPEGSIGLTAPFALPRPNDTIRVTYPEPVCGSGSPQASFRIVRTQWRALDMPAPALPAGAPANEPVLLQALIDIDGNLVRHLYVGGPPALTAAATDAITRWRSEPARINGAPVPAGVLVQVRFADR